MVFVLNKDKSPLNPTSNGKARWLLDNGYAVVDRHFPFVIRLKKQVENPNLKSYTLKIDPGAKETGLAIVESKFKNSKVIFLATLTHRADEISSNLKKRKQYRKSRRSRNTRYRRCKFGYGFSKKNKKNAFESKRKSGWLPPSTESIIQNIKTWVKRLKKWCTIEKVIIETARFDTQEMQNSNIEGVEYQQGTLQGYNVKEYLLYNHNHTCQYCKEVIINKEGKKIYKNYSGDDILEVEHKTPKSQGGTNRLANLTLSCKTCNQDKDNRNLKEWLSNLKEKDFRKKLPRIRYKNVKQILKDEEENPTISLKGAGKVNSYRYRLLDDLKEIIDNIETSTGAKTKYNRSKIANLPKTHYYDALCAGDNISDNFIFPKDLKVMHIKAVGRGSHCRTNTDKHGFPVSYFPNKKVFYGFKTGDIVKAKVPKKYKTGGVWLGKVSIRSTGSFKITLSNGEKIDGVNHKYCTLTQKADGYNYSFKEVI